MRCHRHETSTSTSPSIRARGILAVAISIIAGTSATAEPGQKKEGRDGVYFVCRCEYEVPRGHRLVRFDAPDLLSWIQKVWISVEEMKRIKAEVKAEDWSNTADELAKRTLGGDVYGAAVIWEAMASRRWGPPKSEKAMLKFLRKIDYPEGGLDAQAHFVQAITDDDEIDIAWYLFDQSFADAHPERVAFLLREKWELPTAAAADVGRHLDVPKAKRLSLGKGEGAVYAAFVTSQDSLTLMDLEGGFRFDGIRMDGLVEALVAKPVGLEEHPILGLQPALPDELVLARAIATMEGKRDLVAIARRIHELEIALEEDLEARFSEARFDEERERFLAGGREAMEADWRVLMKKPGRRRLGQTIWEIEPQELIVQESDHLLQIRWDWKIVDRRGKLDPETTVQSWILFDDLWVAAHPELAESILRYATGWNFLIGSGR